MKSYGMMLIPKKKRMQLNLNVICVFISHAEVDRMNFLNQFLGEACI